MYVFRVGVARRLLARRTSLLEEVSNSTDMNPAQTTPTAGAL